MSLIVSYCDTTVFQIFLDAMAAEVLKRRGKRVLLVLDNASWHTSKSLDWHPIDADQFPPLQSRLQPNRAAMAAPKGIRPSRLLHQAKHGSRQRAHGVDPAFDDSAKNHSFHLEDAFRIAELTFGIGSRNEC